MDIGKQCLMPQTAPSDQGLHRLLKLQESKLNESPFRTIFPPALRDNRPTSAVSALINKGDKFYDFLFPFLYTTPSEKGSTLKRKHLLPRRDKTCAQWSLISTRAFTQSNQNLHWAHFGWPVMQCIFLRTTKTLIRLRGCAVWFGCSLGAHIRRYLSDVAARTEYIEE